MRLFHSNRYNSSPWFIIIMVLLFLSIIFTMVTKKDQEKVTAYTKSDKVESKKDTEEDKDLDIDMSIYTDNQTGFSIQVPSDWEQVTKSGYPTFIHSASASSLQIQVLDYDPAINNMSADTASTTVAEDGKTFLSFEKKSSDNYEVQYQDYANSTYDYLEEVYWDRSKIVKLVCVFNDQNYEKIAPYYEKILKSFSWQQSDPIPDGYYLYYNDSLKFEIGIPENWTLGAAENAVVATDSNSGASMTISAQPYTGNLSSMTATDVAALVKNGKNNFIMNNYTPGTDKASVSATYVQNNTQLSNDIYLFTDGSYIYMASFDYEAGTVDTGLSETCANLFRSFSAQAETENSAETTN